MQELLKLAGQIKDKELRQKVVDMLSEPKLSHPGLDYPPADLSTAPASVAFHHVEDGGLVKHTLAVTRMSISVAQAIKESYGLEMDMDALIAGALLHDIGKLFRLKKTDAGWANTDLTLDHTMLGTSELYSRGFPESVMHIVASHFGDSGPTPPQTIEAKVFHTVDNMNATMNAVSTEDVLSLLLK